MRLVLVATALLAVFAQCNGKRFKNPFLDNGDYPDPGAILVDGVYYVVTTTGNTEPEKYPIHTSTDLVNWKRIGYCFTAANLPPWSNKDQAFWAPEIHRVGDSYRLYFTARDVASNHLSIGAATAPHPSGPWKSLDKPLWLDPAGDVLDSTLINDNGNLYLLWKGGVSIKGRPLNPDGLSFSSNTVTEIFRNELPWEDTIVEAPWYVRRGDYHYLFYSGHDYCSELYRVGVARARSPLGPYEKRGDPILASNANLKGPGHNSIVKDLDGVSDVMVFHAFKVNQVCAPWPRYSCLASVGWGTDGWPYIYDWD